jgi:glycosyltransferase involved in cell wall biosynthesis
MKIMGNPTSVLMIGWEYPPHNSGGLGVACEGLTRALAGQNTQIYFTLPYRFPGAVTHMEVVDCADPTWVTSKGSNGTLYSPPFSAYSTTAVPQASSIPSALDLSELRALPQSDIEMKVNQYADMVAQKAVKAADDIDVVHAHDWMALPAAERVHQKTGKPYIAHIHSTEFDRSALGFGSPYITQVEYQGLQRAAKVVTVSFYTKQLLVTRYGIDQNKIEVVHNGLDPLSHAPDPGTHHFAPKRPVVAFMGRLTLQKGGYHFIELARKVLKSEPNALFVVAGSGELFHELLFKAANDSLSASVVFSGFVRDKQREKLLDRADVFVMPSVSEPFGLVALEAAQRHTPVIVSKNAGVSEVMPGSVAVDYWDIERMADTIIDLLRNQGRKQAVIDHQLNDLKSVTWDRSAGRMRQVYESVFLGKSLRGRQS